MVKKIRQIEGTSALHSYNINKIVSRIFIFEFYRVTASKYSDMQQITGNIAKGVNQLDNKYQELQPYLDQIDQIDESVERLFQAAVKLDSYSRRLENKYKELEKRNK